MSELLEKQLDGPYFVRFLAPVLAALHKLGGSARPSEARDLIIDEHGVTDDEQTERVANGTSRFDNQVGWARFYLAKAGYIDSSRRSVWTLTDKAVEAGEMPYETAMDIFHEVQKWSRVQRKNAPKGQEGPDDEDVAPDDSSDGSPRTYRQEVIERLQGLPPDGFERFCQRLLRESGFEQVTVTGRSGDGGIDGIGILEVNPLVSFKVLFQCKRYAGAVGPSQVRDFRGAMQGRADKGIILTTGTFTQDAKREAVRDGVPPIELVDGEKLVKMLEEVEMGLKPRTVYDVDFEFFEQFRS